MVDQRAQPRDPDATRVREDEAAYRAGGPARPRPVGQPDAELRRLVRRRASALLELEQR